jgi:predicted DNA-binding WGR domain protein
MAIWSDKFKNERILIQQEQKHNKFWAAYWDDATNTVYVRWGRIGTKGQSQMKSFGSSTGAVSFIAKKYNEKLRKGYVDKIDGKSVDRKMFEELCLRASIIGTNNKLQDMKWMEWVDGGSPEKSVIRTCTPERLMEPSCVPVLYISFQSKKPFGDRRFFDLVFAADGVYVCSFGRHNPKDPEDGWSGYSTSHSEVPVSELDGPLGEDHPLKEMLEKIEEAIGRTLV